MASRASGLRVLPILPVAGALALAFGGCHAGKSPGYGANAPARASAGATAGLAEGGSGPGVDLNCVVDWLQKPPGSFHYSFSKTGPNFVIESADVTPQTIDGSFKNNSAAQAVHGVASDPQSWNRAWSSLMGIGGMAATIALVNHNSGMSRAGTEALNGYDVIRYAIDTTKADDADAGLYRAKLGDGGFEKGSAWVTDKGCPIKISLDTEFHYRNGTVDTVHYEEEIVKHPQ